MRLIATLAFWVFLIVTALIVGHVLALEGMRACQ